MNCIRNRTRNYDEFAAEAESFVLAGGRSLRMGSDKAMVRLGGRSLIEIALQKLRTFSNNGCTLKIAGEPRIAGTRPDLAAYAPIVEDLHSGCGPLGGIEASLAASSRPLNLFLPVDLPLLPAAVLSWMFERAVLTGALVTYPRAGGRLQPLCAVYHRDLLVPLSRAMDAGERRVINGVAAAAHEVARESQAIDIFDVEVAAAASPELKLSSPLPIYSWFQNCNTPQDLASIAILSGS